MLNSCIYEGVIRHRRRTPAKNSFRFSAFMFLLDLGEIEQVFGGRWFWSTRRFSYASFRREDHMKKFPADRDLKECVKDVLIEFGVDEDIERVCLLTQLRYCGFRMNPVSFYYCYRQSDQRLVAVVVEVNNTPWNQQHCYVVADQNLKSPSTAGDQSELDRPLRPKQRYIRTEKLDKSFHVSPFMHSDMYYRMIFSLPEERIGVKMENYDSAQKIFDVSMLMNRRAITSMRLFWMGVKYPVYSFKVFAGIYYQALKLYFKKVPFVPHPDRQTATEG